MLAGRDIGLGVGVLTMGATWVGGGFINGSAQVSQNISYSKPSYKILSCNLKSYVMFWNTFCFWLFAFPFFEFDHVFFAGDL